MGTIAASAGRHSELSAVVVRCGCTDAQKARPDWHGRMQQMCPNPRATEDLGVIATSKRSFRERAINAVTRIFTKE